MIEFAEEIREFLIESNENLNALDQQIVELEKHPDDEPLIASVFRAIHTIKGTSGFFGFNVLGSITHVAESILGQVREKERPLTPALVSLILETIDAVKQILLAIEGSNEEGKQDYHELHERLDAAYRQCGKDELPPSSSADNMDEKNTRYAEAEGDNEESGELENDAVSCLGEAQGASGTAAFSPPAAQASSHAGQGQLHGEAVLDPAAAELAVAAKPIDTVEQPSPVEDRGKDTANPWGRRASDATEGSTIRVDVALLDKLMNLVGELVLARNQILQGSQHSAASNTTAQRLNLITSELQEGVMLTRMQPIGVVCNKLPRVVRDLAAEMGKKIEIQMEGTSTELDKTIIEAIKDPLTHIVRNACDHGIEAPGVRVAKGKSPQGTILLRAYHEGGHVNIEVSDDGAGIDPATVKSKAVQKGLIGPEQAALMSDWEALRLLFLPGFSTVERVTSISGRGVGMDVVKTNIEKISGTVDIANHGGIGTVLKIKIPLTLAIIPGLIVSVHDRRGAEIEHTHRFVIPQANLVELVRLEGDKRRRQIERIHGVEVYRRRGKLLPLASLREVLGISHGGPASACGQDHSASGENHSACGQNHNACGQRKPDSADPDSVLNIVVVQAEQTAFGLIVDEVNDTQEIVVKALGRQLKSLTCYLGATIMGDGRIALILDLTGLAQRARVVANKQQSPAAEARPPADNEDRGQMLLLFRAGRFPRLVLPVSLVARLEEIPAARTEYAAGQRVLAYRDTIMPLVRLDALLDAGAANGSVAYSDAAYSDAACADAARPADGGSLQVIVFQDRGRYVGMVVDEILDIVHEAVKIKSPGTSFGLLGSGVVGGKVTDFVDLEAVLRRAAGPAADSLQLTPGRARSILLVHPHRIVRGNLRSYLEMHGHRVTEAATLAEALHALERIRMDVLLTAVDLGENTGAELLHRVRGSSSLKNVAVAALMEEDDLSARVSGNGAPLDAFDSCLRYGDRAAILRYLEQLDEQKQEADELEILELAR